MSGIPGTNVAAMVVPIDTADLYATHSDKYGRGGFRVEDTTLTRDAITTLRRREGMWVRVLADGKLYQLGAGLSNADWTEVTLGGNATGINTGDETTATIKAKLGVTTLSGANTGDQVLPTTLPASDVYPWAKAAAKPAYTYTEVGAQVAGDYASGTGSASGTNTGDETTATIKTKLGITTLSGTNTGDETTATIKTKLGITTLSGSNTGDQVIPTTLPASDVSAWAKAATKPAYTYTEVGAQVAGTYATGSGSASGTNTGDQVLPTTMTATVGGLVPTPPNNTTTFLRGDGTFATPPGSSVDLSSDIIVHGVTVGMGAGSVTTDTVVGAEAGSSITTAAKNTLVGYQAGKLLTTGDSNNVFGSESGKALTTGYRNDLFGSAAGVALTTGIRNTFMGFGTGQNISTGYENTLVGGSILSGNASASVSGTTIIGAKAGVFASGGNNTLIGRWAGMGVYDDTGGTNLGGQVLDANRLTTGTDNVFIGKATIGESGGDVNSIVIGANAIGLGSNTTVIGNAATTAARIYGALGVGALSVVAPAGLGYGIGAGGSVTQATSKSTAVTLNKPCGQINTNAAELAAGAVVAFTLSNSLLVITDTIVIHRNAGGSALSYQVWVDSVGFGAAYIVIKNISAVPLSEAIVLHFAIIRGAAS